MTEEVSPASILNDYVAMGSLSELIARIRRDITALQDAAKPEIDYSSITREIANG